VRVLLAVDATDRPTFDAVVAAGLATLERHSLPRKAHRRSAAFSARDARTNY
jgi:hypothetical protein